MPNQFPPELLTTFRSIAEVVYSGDSYDAVYDALCHSALEFVDGCDHASLMLRQHGRNKSAAATDDVARSIDKMEMRIEYDLAYLRSWSLWLDLKIVLKTIVVVLKRQNAH